MHFFYIFFKNNLQISKKKNTFATSIKKTDNMKYKIYIIMRGQRIVGTYTSLIEAIDTKILLNRKLGNFYRIEEAKFTPIWKQTKNIQ